MSLKIAFDLGTTVVKNYDVGDFLPGAVTTLTDLVRAGHQILLMACCERSEETLIVTALDRAQFFEQTGIPRNNLYFVHFALFKWVWLYNPLSVDVAVDTTFPHLGIMPGRQYTKLLFGDQPGPSWLKTVPTWTDIRTYFQLP